MAEVKDRLYPPPQFRIPPISERFCPASLLKICGFGALECLPKHSPVSLLRLCASLVVLKRISSSLPRLIPYARGRRGDDPIPVSCSQMREIRDFDCCRGNRRHCLSLLNAFFLARLPRMHDYHANVSPGSQVSAGRSLLHVCVQIRRLGVLECVMLVQAASAYEVWVVR